MTRAFHSFSFGIAWRVWLLFLTLAALAWAVAHAHWYVTTALLIIAAIAQGVSLAHFATSTNRELARFLDAVAYDDTSRSFGILGRDSGFAELGVAMGRLMDRVRASRSEREEQARYLEAVVAHVPVALLSIAAGGRIQLLNVAARRLFGSRIESASELARFGAGFADALANLPPERAKLVVMERGPRPLHLKASATKIITGGNAIRLVSLSNIETELNAQELAAWQSVIRVLAHEIMNSLTPISSLSATASDLVDQAHASLSPDDALAVPLADARTALETVARRSEALLHFVQTYRHLSRRLVAHSESLRLRRIFARIELLLADELKARGIVFVVRVEPEPLELVADGELLDQALINLLRNAMQALAGRADARIVLSAFRDFENRIVICVTDNGPGIAAELRETVFVPFFTTKREGTGIGLTLARQIAAVHGATLELSEADGGGAVFSLRFG
ncbi:MAG TPA: ATP-binding protein [Rhizomicrobium sp.]|jgi:nitrogen fixation/metabolism regulation signal transduction histidine kinase|nr:ATP-binding protein [Rhizomicrobium sp.]